MKTTGYESAPATKMLATHCVCCGRPLIDATSVQLGIGPECRKGNDGGIPDDIRIEANKCVFDASVAAQHGRVGDVLAIAKRINDLGLDKLAGKVARRFRNVAEKADISVEVEDDSYKVKTPYRRGDSERFVTAWRAIPGRRFRNGANYVPVSQKKALFNLLREFFGGKFAMGPKGAFRIPEPEPRPEQKELAIA